MSENDISKLIKNTLALIEKSYPGARVTSAFGSAENGHVSMSFEHGNEKYSISFMREDKPNE